MSTMNNSARKVIEPLVLKNVVIPSNRIRSDGTETHPRNFRGLKFPPYNMNGERNFTIIVDPEQVDVNELIAKGWNLKQGKPRDDDPNYIPNYYLRVKVKYHPLDSTMSRLNPRVLKVCSGGELPMDEDNIGDLDSDDIVKANMTISGRWTESPTYTGVSAYLKKMVVRVNDDDNLDDLMDGIMDD